jgi:uncharacterized protein
MNAESATVFSPSHPEDRLVHLDVIRGCALFGVLVMNVQYHFRGPFAEYVLDRHPWPGLLNGVVDDFLRLMVQTKAMTLFGMLFAVGLAIQMERKEARGDGGFWGFAWRRMGALMAIGLLHVLLLWEGDILSTYALAGILLFPFLRRKTRTIQVWIVALVVLTLALMVFSIVRRAMGGAGGADAGRARFYAELGDWIVRATAAYGHGTWLEASLFRLQEWSKHIVDQLAPVYETFFNFLLGLAIWRSGVLRAPEAHLPALRKWTPWLVGLGLAGSVVELYFRPLRTLLRGLGPWGSILVLPVSISAEFGHLLLALGYAALILLAWQNTRWRTVLNPFAWTGRMALTNYLTQSLAMTALFYGWGLGLYGHVSPAQGFTVSVVFFALQMLFCRWWLARCYYGPLEWLWRSASYLHFPPLVIRGTR